MTPDEHRPSPTHRYPRDYNIPTNGARMAPRWRPPDALSRARPEGPDRENQSAYQANPYHHSRHHAEPVHDIHRGHGSVYRNAHHHRPIGRTCHLQLGLFGLHAGQHHDDADLREDVRHLRPPAGLRHLNGPLSDWVGPQRPIAKHGAVDRLPGAAGAGRRRRDAARLYDDRRPLLLGAAREDAGDLRQCLGRVGRAWAAVGRLSRGSGVVALGVLRQRAAGHRGHRARGDVLARCPARQ